MRPKSIYIAEVGWNKDQQLISIESSQKTNQHDVKACQSDHKLIVRNMIKLISEKIAN